MQNFTKNESGDTTLLLCKTHYNQRFNEAGGRSCKPVRISGISGCVDSKVNGTQVFVPTNELCDGMTVYHMLDDLDMWLEYGGGAVK